MANKITVCYHFNVILQTPLKNWNEIVMFFFMHLLNTVLSVSNKYKWGVEI